MTKSGLPKGNVPRINNPGVAQRLLQMTPEQRERALEKIPPEQQDQLRRQLDKLDKLPQAEKDRIANRLAAWIASRPRSTAWSRSNSTPSTNFRPIESYPCAANWCN